MRQSLKNIRYLLVYTIGIAVLSLMYFVYASVIHTIPEERETFLTEIGEGFGKAGLGLLAFIYFRTVLKLLLGQGKLAQRLLPDYASPLQSNMFNRLLIWLNRTHVYFGIAAVAVILLHITMMGFERYSHILFFPALLVLIIWQGIFGLFLVLRYSPAELKQFSHLVHAQFITGIAIGVFAFFGHILIDD